MSDTRTEEYKDHRSEWVVMFVDDNGQPARFCVSDKSREDAIATYRKALIDLDQGWTEVEKQGGRSRRRTYVILGVQQVITSTFTFVTTTEIQAIDNA